MVQRQGQPRLEAAAAAAATTVPALSAAPGASLAVTEGPASCPVCQKVFPSGASLSVINRHVDDCLSIVTIDDD